MKKILVLGASLKPHRYSNIAIRSLESSDYDVVAIGLREGEIANIPVQTGFPKLEDIHTVTLYLNAERQKLYYDYIIALKPKRVIFNPGAENFEFKEILEKNDINFEFDCTLVMLSGKRF